MPLLNIHWVVQRNRLTL